MGTTLAFRVHLMTQPRPVIAGASYFITRRCSKREFLMVPDSETRNAFAYLLAWAAKEYNVQIHAAEMMSNHYHACVTDTDGRLPEFFQALHHFFAKFQNVKHGRWDAFWEAKQTAIDILGDGLDVRRQAIYTIANPVRANLVEHVEEWIGLRAIWTDKKTRHIHVKRPERFFDSERWPETMALELTPPRDRISKIEEDRALIAEELANIEKESTAARARQGKAVFGILHVLSRGPGDFPKKHEARRIPRKNIFAHDPELRRALGIMLRGFQAEHRRCYEQMRDGIAVTFPDHTWFGTSAAVAREMVSLMQHRPDSKKAGLNRQLCSINASAGSDPLGEGSGVR